MNLNTTDILNSALSMIIVDDADVFRPKALGWLWETMHDIMNQPRRWQLLKKTSTDLAITSNQATLPTDLGAVINITITATDGNKYFFTPDEELTDEEAFFSDEETGSVPEGYTIESGVITFHPGAEGTAKVKYDPKLPDTAYLDDTAETIFPADFRALLIAGVRKYCYQFDQEDMYTAAVNDYNREISTIKRKDNKVQPLSKRNNHGYIRDRV